MRLGISTLPIVIGSNTALKAIASPLFAYSAAIMSIGLGWGKQFLNRRSGRCLPLARNNVPNHNRKELASLAALNLALPPFCV